MFVLSEDEKMGKSIAKIISWNSDNEAVCASAARMSTTLGNANEIFEKAKQSENNLELLKKVLRSGHKSVIEHAVFSIAFWDVSVFVEQYLIECRLASFTVKSRRYVDFSGQGYLVPEDLEVDSLSVYREYMDNLFDGYNKLLELDVPKEDARFLLPYAFCSNFYCTLNARELCHLIDSIRNGRGSHIPELVDIADQLESQLDGIFPAAVAEVGKNDTVVPAICAWGNQTETLELIPHAEAGGVELLQSPAHPMDILRAARSAADPMSEELADPMELLSSSRPRELEHLNYTFRISDLTLSSITHLVRHRMQSVIIPSIESIDHGRVILPETVENNPQAFEVYRAVLACANELMARVRADENLNKYGYYFAISGNVMTVLTTMNARELLLFLRLRTCNRAQWEIRNSAISMLKLLRADFPELFSHFGPTCVVSGVCPEGRLTCGKKSEVEEEFKKL